MCFHLHRTTTELVIQLGAEDRRGPDFILTGVHALPGETIQSPCHYTEHNDRDKPGLSMCSQNNSISYQLELTLKQWKILPHEPPKPHWNCLKLKIESH